MKNIVNVLSSLVIGFFAVFVLLGIHNIQNEIAAGVGCIAYLVTLKKVN